MDISFGSDIVYQHYSRGYLKCIETVPIIPEWLGKFVLGVLLEEYKKINKEAVLKQARKINYLLQKLNIITTSAIQRGQCMENLREIFLGVTERSGEKRVL